MNKDSLFYFDSNGKEINLSAIFELNEILEKQLDVAKKGLEFISNNEYILDDMSYCNKADMILEEIEKIQPK